MRSLCERQEYGLRSLREKLLNRMMDLERSMRGILRGFGLRVGEVTGRSFEGRIRELVEGHSMLQTVMATCSQRVQP